MSDDPLVFIKDEYLRKNVTDASQHLFYLYFEGDHKNLTNLAKEENCRVMILYCISIIEAILLYIFKERKGEIENYTYQCIHNLPDNFLFKKELSSEKIEDDRIVIAIKKKQIKSDYEIRMVDLIDYFKNKGLMTEITAKKILNVNKIRNTFHLSKSRKEIFCNLEEVEKALSVLINIIKKAPSALKN